MKIAGLLALALGLMLPPVAFAQREDELMQQLEAQKALNARLRQRIEELERASAGLPSAPALRPPQPRPPAPEPEATTAIEEALVARGLVLLPLGSFRAAPGFTWQHAGTDALRTRSDTYAGSLSLQAGLPFGMMASAHLPYVHRRTSIGSNSGPGDFSLGLSKTLKDETDRSPALIASVNYLHDSGDDPFGAIPLGSGFRAVTLGLSALKRVEPVALFGGASYTHAQSRNVIEEGLFGASTFDGQIEPGDAWSYRFGASLAATPEITLDASLSGAFLEGARVRSDAAGSFKLPKSTVALINLGAGFTLGRNLSLLISASAGTTDDSPDFIFSASLPYRF
jgi:hypothetical protein